MASLLLLCWMMKGVLLTDREVVFLSNKIIIAGYELISQIDVMNWDGLLYRGMEWGGIREKGGCWVRNMTRCFFDTHDENFKGFTMLVAYPMRPIVDRFRVKTPQDE